MKNLKKFRFFLCIHLLNDYLFLKKDIISIMEKDLELEDFYYKEFLMYYDININKIKNELSLIG